MPVKSKVEIKALIAEVKSVYIIDHSFNRLHTSRDSNPPVLAGNLLFSTSISGLPFSLNMLPIFETLPSQRKIMFSLFNQSF